jgi:hypothetical protein
VSTPSGRPVRPASVFDYAPRRVREQREQFGRGDASDAAGEEYDDPRVPMDDPAPAKRSGDGDNRVYPLVPKGPHERHERKPDDAEDERGEAWEDAPESRPDPRYAEADDRDAEADDRDAEADDRDAEEDDRYAEADDRYADDRYAEADDRHAAATGGDRDHDGHRDDGRDGAYDVYEHHLERLAASLRILRGEDEPAEAIPKSERQPRARPSPDADERDVYIDGMRVPNFLQSSYVPLQPGREGRSHHTRAIFAVAIACAVTVPVAYWFAAGNLFASSPRGDMVKSGFQYAVASVSEHLPKPDQPTALETAMQQQGLKPLPTMAQIEPQAEPPVAQQAPRPVPLTRVMRWPADQAQDSGTPQAPRLASVEPKAGPPRVNAAPMPAPNAPSQLALAPATAPAPAQPKPTPTPTPALGPDEVQLMLKQGQEFVAAGDLATARTVLRRAAEGGAAAAALALGRTYDPKVLAKMRARGVSPDVGEARRWYEMAQQLGSAEAARQLDLLARDSRD